MPADAAACGRRLFFFALVLMMIAPFAQAGEGAGGLQGEVLAGFGGYYRIGKCLPVKVRLTNSGADLSGEIAVQMPGAVFAQVLSLPSPSRKTLSFYVIPNKDLHELQAGIYSDQRLITTYKSPVRRLGDGELLTVISSTLRAVPSFSSSSGSNAKEIKVFVDPGDLPEEWRDYDAVNTVILESSDTGRLNESQRSALSRWTLLGGRVTLFDRDKAAAERSIQNPHGLGSFGMVAGFQPAAEGGAADYRASLMDVDQEVFDASRIREPVSRAPIFWYVAGFLFIYGSVVAFSVFASNGAGWRGLWRLSIVPVIALLFAAFSPGIGRIVNAGKAQVRQHSVIHVFANTADTFTTNELLLLSARKGTGRFGPAISSTYMVQNALEETDRGARYEFPGRGSPSLVLQTDLWRPTLFSVASFSDRSVFLGLRGPEYVTLANQSAFPLHDCTLIRYGVSVPIGEIPAGQEIRLKLDSLPDHPDSSSRRTSSPAMFSRVLSVYETETVAGSIGDCVVCAMAGSFPVLTSGDTDLFHIGSTAVVYHLANRPEGKDDSNPK